MTSRLLMGIALLPLSFIGGVVVGALIYPHDAPRWVDGAAGVVSMLVIWSASEWETRKRRGAE